MSNSKLIGATIAVAILFAPATAWADWQPSLNPGQSVYIDPALANHASSPIKFQTELEKQIDELQAKSGINYYVWAIETNDVPQKGKSLGVQKTDEAIAAWSGLSAFPRDNYTLIVWARRSDNPAKGGMGINVSNGLKKPDVPSILKEYMPRNPQGAVMAIARSVADAKATDVFLGEFGIGALILLGISALGALLSLVWRIAIDALKPNFAYKKKSIESISLWKKATSNAASIYHELTDDKTIEFYSALEKEGELADFLKKTNVAVNKFLCFYQTATDALDRAVEDQKLGNHKAAFFKLDGEHKVNFGKLPLEKASIFGGLDDVEAFKGIRLLPALDDATRNALECWAILKLSINADNPSEFLVQYFGQKRREEEAKQSASFLQDRESIMARARAYAAKSSNPSSSASKTSSSSRLTSRSSDPSRATTTSHNNNNNTVFIDNSIHSSWSSSSSSGSSSSSSSSGSDWSSSGSDYSSSDSSGGDY